MITENPKKERISVTLSSATRTMVKQLQEMTDADSQSEVIRNCIRLAYAISEAENARARIIIEHPDGEKDVLTLRPVMPIAPEDD